MWLSARALALPAVQKAQSLVPSIEKGRREGGREGGRKRTPQLWYPPATCLFFRGRAEARWPAAQGKKPLPTIPLSPSPEDRPFSVCPLSLLSHWYLWALDQEVNNSLNSVTEQSSLHPGYAEQTGQRSHGGVACFSAQWRTEVHTWD